VPHGVLRVVYMPCRWRNSANRRISRGSSLSVEGLPVWGFDPRTVQPIASRYIDYAIPPHLCLRLGKMNISKIESDFFSLFHRLFPKPQNFCMK
jgi:hypothetical protein